MMQLKCIKQTISVFHAVVEGEELYFGFKCIRMNLNIYSLDDIDAEKKPIIHVILRDEFGKTFRQVLPFDLDRFILKWTKKTDMLK